MILIQVGLEARYAGADAMGSDKPYKRYHDNLHDIAVWLTSKRVDAKENLCLKIMMFILCVIYIYILQYAYVLYLSHWSTW